MAIPVRIRRNADGSISDITLCPKQEDIYSELAKVKNQLAIAVEALKDIIKEDMYNLDEHRAFIEEKLKMIKELEK